MLGEKIGETSGRVTGRRVPPQTGASPNVETSYEATGRVLGVEITEVGTYSSSLRPDGTLFGEGQGIVMGKQGEVATWTGHGVGTLKKDGAVSYRGAVYYQTPSAAWSRLNTIAALFEYEMDAQGNSRAAIWEWT